MEILLLIVGLACFVFAYSAGSSARTSDEAAGAILLILVGVIFICGSIAVAALGY